jgi:nicotinamidase-related amidase
MKKILSVIILIALFGAGNCFSQDNNVQKSKRMKPALLVIDIQNTFLPMVPDREKEVGMYMINAMIDLFRKNGFPIIRVYHQDLVEGPKTDSEAFEFPTTVQIKPEDPRVIKHYGDGFNKTDLDKIIKEKGCNTVFMCGLSAVGCVLATYIGAENHDVKAFLIKDAIMSHNSTYTDNIEEIFGAISYDVVKTMLENAEK